MDILSALQHLNLIAFFGAMVFSCPFVFRPRRIAQAYSLWRLRAAVAAGAAMVALVFEPSSLFAQTNFDEEILYINDRGTIHVLDTNQANVELIDWSSHEDGFFDFTVGDFNADGDAEVAAIKGEGGTGRLVVYDPVVSPDTAIPTEKSSNGVPWKLLYERNIGFTPLVIGAGNLDISTPEDELLIGYEIGNERSEVKILKLEPNNNLGDVNVIEYSPGSNEVQPIQFDRTWNSVSIGQIDGVGAEEVVFTDSTMVEDQVQSEIAFYRVEGLVADSPFFKRGNSFASWRRTVIGDVEAGGYPEIVAIRKVNLQYKQIVVNNQLITVPSNPIPTVFFFKYDPVNQTILDNDDGCPDEPYDPKTCPDDVDGLFLNPRPNTVFLADVNNSGDKEALFLREVPAGQAPVRFFLINRGSDNDTFPNLDQRPDAETGHPLNSLDIGPLDQDNLWRLGTGGDFDGNGTEEVAIGRPNTIRIYRYNGNNFESIRSDFVRSGNLRMEAANLDRNGFTSGIELFASSEALQEGIYAGVTTPIRIDIRSFDQPVTAKLEMPNQPRWLTVHADLPLAGRTNGFSIDATIDARNLLPGEYSFELRITSSDAQVRNSPVTEMIRFSVIPVSIESQPAEALQVLFPCEGGEAFAQPPMTQTLSIAGTPGITFTAAIVADSVASAEVDFLGGPLKGTYVDEEGAFRLRDRQGKQRVVNLRGGLADGEVRVADRIEWPSEVPWVRGSSVSDRLPTEFHLVYDPVSGREGAGNLEATLFLFVDPQMGETSLNVWSVPVKLLCARSRVFLPISK